MDYADRMIMLHCGIGSVRQTVRYRSAKRLSCPASGAPHSPVMFVVTETDTAVIRAAFDQGGELSAAIEVRRLFPGIIDNVKARECARMIIGWKPPPVPTSPVTRLIPARKARPVSWRGHCGIVEHPYILYRSQRISHCWPSIHGGGGRPLRSIV